MSLSDHRIREMLSGDLANFPPCSRLLGFELIDFSVEERWLEAAFNPTPEFANPMGWVQGGFVTAMLDDAMSLAAVVSQRFEIIVLTLQLNISYMAPTPVERVIVRGEAPKVGRSSVFMRGTLRDTDGVILAEATSTAVPRPHPYLPREGDKGEVRREG